MAKKPIVPSPPDADGAFPKREPDNSVLESRRKEVPQASINVAQIEPIYVFLLGIFF
jgi:hypothetical protein